MEFIREFLAWNWMGWAYYLFGGLCFLICSLGFLCSILWGIYRLVKRKNWRKPLKAMLAFLVVGLAVIAPVVYSFYQFMVSHPLMN